MTTQRSIWLLTSGDYSAYTVHAAFTDQTEALKCSTVDPELTVEEYAVYEQAPEALVYFTATVDNIEKSHYLQTPAGEVNVQRDVSWPWDGYPMVPGGWNPHEAITAPPVVYGDVGEHRLYVRVVRTDEEQARKIAADTYAAEMVKRGW